MGFDVKKKVLKRKLDKMKSVQNDKRKKKKIVQKDDEECVPKEEVEETVETSEVCYYFKCFLDLVL